jgi:hypothetical protein
MTGGDECITSLVRRDCYVQVTSVQSYESFRPIERPRRVGRNKRHFIGWNISAGYGVACAGAAAARGGGLTGRRTGADGHAKGCRRRAFFRRRFEHLMRFTRVGEAHAQSADDSDEGDWRVVVDDEFGSDHLGIEQRRPCVKERRGFPASRGAREAVGSCPRAGRDNLYRSSKLAAPAGLRQVRPPPRTVPLCFRPFPNRPQLRKKLNQGHAVRLDRRVKARDLAAF